MYPSKRKCNDVCLDYQSANATRPTTKRYKSAELLTDNGEDKMKIYTFSDQDYGEESQPADTNRRHIAAINQRQYQSPNRRLNRSQEGSLDVDNDDTCPKECYCSPESRYVPRYARRKRPPTNTSPDWKSTPSLPTLYSSTYCRHSDASNCRLEDTRILNECGRGLTVTKDRLQHGGCIQNRLMRERSVPVLVGGRSNNIIDPLSKGNIMSPGIYNGQTHRGLLPLSCDNCDGHNMNEIVIEQSRPRYLDLHGNATGRSVETLDVYNDLVQNEPESGQRLLQRGDKSNKVKTPDNTCRGCVSISCPAIRSASYLNRFNIVLILNLMLVTMNILWILIVISSMGPGAPEVPGLYHRCINCSQLNPFCDIKSLGLIREVGDQCCLNPEDSLFTTMLKAVDVYIDCRLSGLQDIFQIPVIQYSVENGHTDQDQENRIIWKEHADVPPKGFGSLKYSNSLILINKPGHYFIYTKVMYKKQSSAHAPVSYSIMKENFKNHTRTEIDYVNEYCFTETTPRFTEHGSHIITVHKFGESEGVYVKLNNKVDFDKYSGETKILIFYMNLERKHTNTTKIADSLPITHLLKNTL